MSHVTKDDLAEINEELTETLRRLDEENVELMEQVKTGAIEDLKEESSAVMSDLRKGRGAVNAAVAEQKETAMFTVLIAGMSAVAAAGGVLWIQEAGISPMYPTLGALTILILIGGMKWARSKKTSENL